MKFKVDGNLPRELAEFLRNLGHDADTVPDEGLAGAPDPALLGAAKKHNRVLLTLDKGMAHLARHPKHSHSGVVLFRPDAVGRQSVLGFVQEKLAAVLQLELTCAVTVISETRIRQR